MANLIIPCQIKLKVFIQHCANNNQRYIGNLTKEIVSEVRA